MSTPASSAASKLRERVAGRDEVGALVADAALIAGIPGTSTSCGCRRPGRAAAIGSPQRGHGRPARSVDRCVARPDARRARTAACRGRVGADDRQRLLVGHRAGRPPRVDAGREAGLGLPEVPDPGDRALVEQRVADRPRVGSSSRRRRRKRARRSSAARMSGPSAARRRSKRVRDSVSSSSTGPSNCTTSCPRGAQDEPGAPGRAPPAAPRAVRRPRRRSSAGASAWSGRPRSAGTGACRGRRPTSTARPASRSGQRSCGEARVRRDDLVGDPALQHGRIRLRGVVDRVALGHRAVASGHGARSRGSSAVQHVEPAAIVGASALTGASAALVRPGTADEVAAVVRWCYGRTSRGAGRRPDRLRGRGRAADGRRRRDRARPPHARALVRPAAVAHGGRGRRDHRDRRTPGPRERPALPPDPGAAEQSQLGGNIAGNAGGPHAFRTASTGAWVTGVEAVLAPGELVRLGGPVRKDVAGYDLRGLLGRLRGNAGDRHRGVAALHPGAAGGAAGRGVFADAARRLRGDRADPGQRRACPPRSSTSTARTVAARRRAFPARRCPTPRAGDAGDSPSGVRGDRDELARRWARDASRPREPGVASCGAGATACRSRSTARAGPKLSEDIGVPLDRLAEAELGRRDRRSVTVWRPARGAAGAAPATDVPADPGDDGPRAAEPTPPAAAAVRRSSLRLAPHGHAASTHRRAQAPASSASVGPSRAAHRAVGALDPKGLQPAEGPTPHALSVSLRGPARKPSSIEQRPPTVEPTTGSPSTRSSESLRRRPPRTNAASASKRRAQARVVGVDERQQAAAAALDVERRARRRPGRRGRPRRAAGAPLRSPSRLGHGSAAP